MDLLTNNKTPNQHKFSIGKNRDNNYSCGRGCQHRGFLCSPSIQERKANAEQQRYSPSNTTTPTRHPQIPTSAPSWCKTVHKLPPARSYNWAPCNHGKARRPWWVAGEPGAECTPTTWRPRSKSATRTPCGSTHLSCCDGMPRKMKIDPPNWTPPSQQQNPNKNQTLTQPLWYSSSRTPSLTTNCQSLQSFQDLLTCTPKDVYYSSRLYTNPYVPASKLPAISQIYRSTSSRSEESEEASDSLRPTEIRCIKIGKWSSKWEMKWRWNNH